MHLGVQMLCTWVCKWVQLCIKSTTNNYPPSELNIMSNLNHYFREPGEILAVDATSPFGGIVQFVSYGVPITTGETDMSDLAKCPAAAPQQNQELMDLEYGDLQ